MSLIGTISHVAEQVARVEKAHAAYVQAVAEQAAAAVTVQPPAQKRQETAATAGKGK
jgi:hypothetical protein